MNKFPLLSFLFTCFLASGQENRILISGKVTNDTIPIENVHVINKNSQKGSITNQLGQFKLSVTDKDTLMISDIQYQNKIIIVNHDHLLTKYLEINLLELMQVKHNMTD